MRWILGATLLAVAIPGARLARFALAPLDSAISVLPRLQVRALYNIPREALPAFAPLFDVGTLAALQ